jgi:hypothetical protein
MANTQSQFGFKHQGYLSGGAPDYQLATYPILKSNATAIGFGDPVSYANATSPYVVQSIQNVNATGNATAAPIVGIFQGCVYIPTTGLQIPQWSPYWPGVTANVDATAYVIDAPNAKFLVATLQTAVTSANIGNVVNFTTGAPATTGGGFSIATIDQSTATSLATTTIYYPFRVLGLYAGVGNGSDPTTNYNWAVVGFNWQLNRTFVGA